VVKGLGLGLYLVQQIVQAHEGTVSLESSGTGQTTFRIMIARSSTATLALDD